MRQSGRKGTAGRGLQQGDVAKLGLGTEVSLQNLDCE